MVIEASLCARESTIVGIADFIELAIDNITDNVRFHSKRRIRERKCIITTENIGSRLLITFEDNGVGIRVDGLEWVEPFKQLIFTPKFTTSEPFPDSVDGLGLANVYQIVRLHGGMITAENKVAPETGAVFKIYLPLVSPEEPPAAAEARWLGELIVDWIPGACVLLGLGIVGIVGDCARVWLIVHHRSMFMGLTTHLSDFSFGGWGGTIPVRTTKERYRNAALGGFVATVVEFVGPHGLQRPPSHLVNRNCSSDIMMSFIELNTFWGDNPRPASNPHVRFQEGLSHFIWIIRTCPFNSIN